MSDLPTASTPDPAALNAAIEALTADLADRPYGPGSSAIPILSHLTLMDLETLAAALARPHIPGCVEVDEETWKSSTDKLPCAIATVWPRRGVTERHYFAPAVTA
jgi:hypothetical protein